MFKKIVSFVTSAIMVVGMITHSTSLAEAHNDKLNVVCTIFPEYDWTYNIVGNNPDVDLTLLIDNGTDLHSFQPSAQDMVTISNCDVFIYVGGTSETWVDDALKNANNKNMQVINLLDVLDTNVKTEEVVEGMQEEPHEHDHDDHDDHDDDDEYHNQEVEYDEHVWLSLTNAETICNYICDVMCSIDSNNSSLYKDNTAKYINKLQTLDDKYKSMVEGSKRKTIMFGDRFPFRYLVDDYGIDYYAVFVGCSAETEASFKTVTFLANKLDELKLPTVLTLETSDQAIAKTIVSNTTNKNQSIQVMNSMQSVTANDIANGTSYLSIMEQNYNVLDHALNDDVPTGSALASTTEQNSGGFKDTLTKYLSYPFVRYALIVGTLIALCSSILGVILVLKRFSFIGDGLSHVAFGALAVATVFSVTNNMIVILPVTVISAILLLRTGQNTKIKGDSAIAMISVGALALGYLLMNVFSTSGNVSGDVCSTLFGSTLILTLSNSDVWLCIAMSVIVLLIFILFYNRIFSVTFDESFATATGTNANTYNTIISIITAIIIVLAMNLVGSLLISALIIFPALSSMRVFSGFKVVIVSSAIISVVCAVSGILISILLSTPVGSTIVAVDIVVFLIFYTIGTFTGKRA